MAKMTEEEADALDELWTNTTPAIDTSRSGYFTRHMAHLVELDDLSAAYLRAKADAARKTPAEIISDMVHREMKIAAAP
ncbi:MAG: hypothetical protein LBK66_06160 [Spirochaetaceae bacterium]|jgi:hypothetical protein|nr:hypothetical protein [Spirochaetaceae bacterium]